MSAVATNTTLIPQEFTRRADARVVCGGGGKLIIENAYSLGGKIYDIEVAKVGVDLAEAFSKGVFNESQLKQRITAVFEVYSPLLTMPVVELMLTNGRVAMKDAAGQERSGDANAPLDAERFKSRDVAGELEQNIAPYRTTDGLFTVSSAVEYVARRVLMPHHLGDCSVFGTEAYSLRTFPHGSSPQTDPQADVDAVPGQLASPRRPRVSSGATDQEEPLQVRTGYTGMSPANVGQVRRPNLRAKAHGSQGSRADTVEYVPGPPMVMSGPTLAQLAGEGKAPSPRPSVDVVSSDDEDMAAQSPRMAQRPKRDQVRRQDEVVSSDDEDMAAQSPRMDQRTKLAPVGNGAAIEIREALQLGTQEMNRINLDLQQRVAARRAELKRRDAARRAGFSSAQGSASQS